MAKPVIAIVGRPNVGKSTLFNKLIGERRAIVEDTPGQCEMRIQRCDATGNLSFHGGRCGERFGRYRCAGQ